MKTTLLLLLSIAALGATASNPPECLRASTPAACYDCCIAVRPPQIPEEEATRACRAVCRYTPPAPPSESRP